MTTAAKNIIEEESEIQDSTSQCRKSVKGYWGNNEPQRSDPSLTFEELE